MNLFILAVYVIFGVSIAVGLLVGAMRGRRKAFLRCLTLAAAFILSLLVTPLVSSIALKSSIDRIQNFVNNEWVTVATDAGSDSISKIVSMLINPLVFIVVFVVFWLLSLIVYWILSATVGKRKMDKNGEEKPKGKFSGMLLGLACGFIMFLVLFVPINGYLSLAKQLNSITIDGETALSSVENQKWGSFYFGIEEYNDKKATKALGLSIDKVCFDYLSSATVRGEKISLRDELDVLPEVMEKYNALNKDDILGDAEALESFVGAAFESKIVVVAVDVIIDFIVSNPEKLDDIISSEDGGSSTEAVSFFENKEMLITIFTGLKGHVKEQLDACIGVLYIINDMNISLTDLDADILSTLSDENMETLVNAIFDVQVIRDITPYAIGNIIQPLAESIGVSTEFKRPVLTDEDWSKEKKELINVFRSINIVLELADLSGNISSEELKVMENFFGTKNAETMGSLMESLKESKLMRPLYNSLTEFDQEKDEYFFISYLDKLVFGGTSQENLQLMKMTAVSSTQKSLRPLFLQSEAVKPGSLSSKDNINFEKFEWTQLFADISDMFGFMINIKDLEGKKNTEASVEEITDMLKNLDEMDKGMLQNVLETLIPEGSGIKIPEINDDIDFNKEAEIYEDLFKYQEKKNNGQTITQAEVDDIVDSLAESEFIVQVLESSNSKADATSEEKQWIEEKLDSSEYDDNTKEAIRKLFGISN